MTGPRILFAGTPQFAVPSLTRLVEADVDVVCVLTQPDRKRGRGQKFKPSAVKSAALDLNLDVMQIGEFNSRVLDQIRVMDLDLLVVVAFGLIFPAELLEVPRLGCVNVHPSLLPRWRGAAPIQRAIEAGDSVTGVTIMQVSARVDTGPMLQQVKYPIEQVDTAATLSESLARLGADELNKVLPSILAQQVEPVLQNDCESKYASKVTRKEALIDWSDSAAYIERKIRALNPWPVAHSFLGSDRIQIWKARLDSENGSASVPGEILCANKRKLAVSTGSGALSLLEVQRIGRKRMRISDFLNGYQIQQNQKFHSNK